MVMIQGVGGCGRGRLAQGSDRFGVQSPLVEHPAQRVADGRAIGQARLRVARQLQCAIQVLAALRVDPRQVVRGHGRVRVEVDDAFEHRAGLVNPSLHLQQRADRRVRADRCRLAIGQLLELGRGFRQAARAAVEGAEQAVGLDGVRIAIDRGLRQSFGFGDVVGGGSGVGGQQHERRVVRIDRERRRHSRAGGGAAAVAHVELRQQSQGVDGVGVNGQRALECRARLCRPAGHRIEQACGRQDRHRLGQFLLERAHEGFGAGRISARQCHARDHQPGVGRRRRKRQRGVGGLRRFSQATRRQVCFGQCHARGAKPRIQLDGCGKRGARGLGFVAQQVHLAQGVLRLCRVAVALDGATSARQGAVEFAGGCL